MCVRGCCVKMSFHLCLQSQTWVISSQAEQGRAFETVPEGTDEKSSSYFSIWTKTSTNTDTAEGCFLHLTKVTFSLETSHMARVCVCSCVCVCPWVFLHKKFLGLQLVPSSRGHHSSGYSGELNPEPAVERMRILPVPNPWSTDQNQSISVIWSRGLSWM